MEIKYNIAQIVSIKLDEGCHLDYIKYHPKEIITRKYLFGLFKRQIVKEEWYEELGYHNVHDVTYYVVKQLKNHYYFLDEEHKLYKAPIVKVSFSNEDCHTRIFGSDRYNSYDEALHYAKLHYDSLCNSNNLIDLAPFIK